MLFINHEMYSTVMADAQHAYPDWDDVYMAWVVRMGDLQLLSFVEACA